MVQNEKRKPTGNLQIDQAVCLEKNTKAYLPLLPFPVLRRSL